jgi:hypothetical protein
MADEFFLSFVVPFIFLATGIVLLISAARHRARTLLFLAKAREATGVVIAIKSVAGDPDGMITYAPVVAFTTDNGRKAQFASQTRSSSGGYAVGAFVPVLYDSNYPDQARIRSFLDLWGLPSLLGGLGLVFTLVGGGLLIFGVPA